MNGNTASPVRQPVRVLIEAPFHAGLEVACVAELAARAANGEPGPLFVLVPSREVRLRLRRRLADAGVSTFDLRFRLFPELAEDVLAAAGGAAAAQPVRGPALRVLLGGVIRRWREEGAARVLAGVADLGGFLAALQRALVELDEAAVEPARLARLAAALGTPRLEDLAALHQAWRDTLARRGLESRALRIARAAGSAGALPAAEFVAYGFYDMTGVQRRLFAALLEGRAARYYLPGLAEEGASYVAPMRAWIEGLGFRPAPPPATLAPPIVEPALTLFSAAGERREAEEVVRRVVARLAEGDLAPGEVALLYRAADPYALHLREALERAGLPARHLDPAPLAETAAGTVARLYLRAAVSDFGRRALLDFFDAVPPERLRAAGGAQAAWSVAEWEALTAEAGITQGRRGWDERLARLEGALRRQSEPAGGAAEAEEAAIPGAAIALARHRLAALRALRKELSPLFAGFERLAAAVTWGGLAEAAAATLALWLPPGAAGDAVLEAVRSMARLELTGEPAELAQFLRACEETLSGLPAPGAAGRPDGILVGGVMAVRGVAFRAVYLLGLNEQVFPRGLAPDPFLRDQERERLQGDDTWLPLRRRAREEEATLFELALRAAPELTLSWSRIEPAEARPRLASAFLLRYLGARAGRFVDHEALAIRAERVPLDRLAPARAWGRQHPTALVPEDAAGRFVAWHALDRPEFDRLLLSAAAGAGDVAAILATRSRLPALARALRAEQARWGEPRLTAWDGRLQSAEARAVLERRYPPDAIWSPTALERYAACPFHFFVERLLEAEETEEPEELTRLAPQDRGELLHAILREFLAEPAEVATLRAAPDRHRARLRNLAERHLAAFEQVGLVGRPLMWTIEQDRMLDDLDAWFDFELDRGDALLPAWLELRFGMRAADGAAEDRRSSDEPLSVADAEGRIVRFRGRIDRVDLDEARTTLRVIDYKSGARRGSRAAGFASGESLQLPVYLLAAAAREPRVRIGQAEYLFLGGGVSRDALPPGELGPLRRELARIAQGLAAGIRAGHFFPFAGVAGTACENCRLGSVCGGGVERRFQMKSGDPAVREFLARRAGAATEDGV